MMDTRTWMTYWRRALWISYLLRYVPFVRMVGLNGSMVTGTFRSESDIDVYIVTKDGHLFLGRFLATILIALTGLKIRSGREAGMICSNRFAIESFVDITPHDAYHARVFHNLIPLFDGGGVYAKYCAANQWMSDSEPLVVHQPVLRHSVVSRFVQVVGEWLLGSPNLEARIQRWQEQRIAQDPRAHAKGSKVVVSKRELRFHLAKGPHV
jgi:hypothetical protein